MYQITATIKKLGDRKLPYNLFIVEANTIQEAIKRLEKKFDAYGVKYKVTVESIHRMDREPWIILKFDG